MHGREGGNTKGEKEKNENERIEKKENIITEKNKGQGETGELVWERKRRQYEKEEKVEKRKRLNIKGGFVRRVEEKKRMKMKLKEMRKNVAFPSEFFCIY
jgi:hypothetical protein